MSGPKSLLNFFVIGDVHGCAEELKALIHKLPLDQNSTLLFLGDYVDRGPDSKAVIDTVLDLSEVYRVIALKGNHEWLMEQYLANPNNPVASGNFILNGGSATLASYSADGATYTIPSSHRNFLKGLKLFHATESHFYVHAGIPPNYDFDSTTIDEKTAHQFLWIRNVFLESKVKWPKIVVHGHTPMEAAEILPNRINLDTGCVFGRRLSAMNMATGELISVERNQGARPTFLTQSLSGHRDRAQRFAGNVTVEILVGSIGFAFHTVNYNEFGLLIHAAPGAEHLKFAVGESLKGLIKPGGDSIFHFQATVMRAEEVKGVPQYGLRFDKLENLAEL
ncbi:MAG: metallophosphoesterase [Bdellovibrionota bacterium]